MMIAFSCVITPNSDQYQFSSYIINAYLTSTAIGIQDLITQGEFSSDTLKTFPQYFHKKTMGTRWENLFFDIRG